MSTPRYSATQLLTGATLTYRNAAGTTESLGTQFPASNVADAYAGTVAKLPRVELGSIVWQWSSSKAWNCVAFLNHNMESDVVLKVQKSSDGSTWSDVQTGISLTSQRYWVNFTEQTSVWGRILLTSVGSQVALPYLGELWVGNLVALSRNHAFGVQVGRGFLNEKLRTTWGRPIKYQKSSFDKISGVMADGLTAAELAELEALIESLKGSAQPFLFVPDGAVATECWIAEYMSDEWSVSVRTAGPTPYDGLKLDIQEIPWGKPVS